MSFDEVRFPTDVNFGARGGPEFETDIVVTDSGGEFRNANRDQSLGRWVVGHRIKTRTEFQTLLSFFRARKGRFRGFRFKDWMDYQSVTEALGPLTGSKTVQLIKTYTSGAVSDVRKIVKPVAGTVTLRRNASPFAGFSLNTATGLVTLTPDATANVQSLTAAITDITQDNPGVVTTSGNHGFVTGDPIRLTGITGMTELNTVTVIVTVLSPTTFSIGLDTSSFSPYVSGGTATLQGASQTNPAYLRVPGHGYSTNDAIYVSGLGGMVELNDQPFVITVIDADRFTVPVDATGFTLYTTGGVAEHYVQPSETLDWSGEFDVPVRFDTDHLDAELFSAGLDNWDGIPIQETRDFQ